MPQTAEQLGAAEQLQPLANFRLDNVLSEDSLTKRISMLGRFDGKPGQAIIALSRRHFDAGSLQQLLSEAVCTEQQFQNDVYSKYTATVPAGDAAINVDITAPATEKHISKHREQEYFMVRETPEMYSEVTLPYIESLPTSRIKWVYNILDKKAEAERLLFEDADPVTGFMLHPDLKWDRSQISSLYCIALCHTRDIRSVRDLTAAHLPLLRNIRHKGSEIIKQTFGVSADQLRLYVHYQPSYWHFHVHFVHTGVASAAGAAVGKAILLDDVIENLTTVSGDYYQRRTLMFSLGSNDPLMQSLMKRKATSHEVAE